MMILRQRVALAGLALAAALVLTSCASVDDRVRAALDSASSATASASIALTLYGDGRALPGFTDTILGDALTELDGATTDLTQSGPIGSSGAADRDEAVFAIRAATDAVLAARETVASSGDPAGDVRTIDHVTETLHALSESTGS